ncbi:hypothetical protein ACVWW9_001232 [Agrococcus sp. UYP33]
MSNAPDGISAHVGEGDDLFTACLHLLLETREAHGVNLRD